MTAKDIKRIRTQALLTQKEFADELGVSIATIQTWEHGTITDMRFNNIRRVLEFCERKGICV